MGSRSSVGLEIDRWRDGMRGKGFDSIHAAFDLNLTDLERARTYYVMAYSGQIENEL